MAIRLLFTAVKICEELFAQIDSTCKSLIGLRHALDDAVICGFAMTTQRPSI